MASMTRGPLPPGVYWRRRLFVLALAGALVFIVAGLLHGGSDGSDDGAPVAQQAGADYDIPSVTVDADERGGKHARRGTRVRATYGPSFDPNVLAEPSGACDPADVTVTPRVEDGVAGRDVTIGLSLRSTGAAACTWHMTGSRLLVRITDADQEIWSTRECPAAVPDKDVVVRDVVATVVELTWNARESDEHCRPDTAWVMPGDYSIAAAVLGGEPDQTDFELTRATSTVTVTPTPTPTPEPKHGHKYQGRDDLGPDGRPLGQNTDVPTR